MDIICFSFNTNHHIIAHEFSLILIFLIRIFSVFSFCSKSIRMEPDVKLID